MGKNSPHDLSNRTGQNNFIFLVILFDDRKKRFGILLSSNNYSIKIYQKTFHKK